ncbi:acyl carrier protein [Nocardia sp. NPDC005998]|uniref:acyl carrier protein n=1 Tax=Nocardia sp. NPDC005998 TaxID=3156894 RepID=UPI0033BECFD5
MPVLAAGEKDQIKETVCTILELEPEEVTDSSLFKDDHGADSLLAIEILAQLERTFKITIDQSELERLVNLEGVYAVVEEARAA